MKLYSLILCAILVVILSSCEEKTPKRDTYSELKVFDHQYAHVVYFWFKDDQNRDDKIFFEKSLRKFLNSSKYAKTEFIGTAPKATREVVDDSFTYNLILSFESAAAQEAYQEEEAHKLFVKECSHLWAKVVVYDAQTITD